MSDLMLGYHQNLASGRSYDLNLLNRSMDDSRRAQFDQFVSKWLAETRYFSSISMITSRPEFQKLVSMGEPALRFLLERMAGGDVRLHWFPLLKRIAGSDPVPVESRGVIPEMTNAWLDWARQNRIITR
jgi:hypothetical protein